MDTSELPLLRQRRKVTPTMAVKILAEHGTKVNKDQAKLILDFMYKFGQIALDQYVKI